MPPLDVTHSASSQLPHSLSLSVTLLLHTPSHALYLHLSLSGSFSPLFYIPPSLYASLELSPLSCFFFASVTCLSFLCSLIFLLAGHNSPLLCLTNSEYSSKLKPSSYLCLSGLVFFYSPLCWAPLVFLSLLANLLSSFSRLFHISPS